MNRRAKVIATISTLCLAIVMLTVSVLAATSVSFTIGGTVAYELKDVLVDVNTNFYYSIDNTVLKGDAITTKADLVAGETLPTDLTAVDGFTPRSVSTYKNGQVVELTEEEKTISGLQVKFGKYESESEEKKSYSYYLVMEVTNHGENTIAVNVVDNTTAENVEKLATTSINFVNNGVEIAKNETKKVVVAFNLTDLMQNISSTDFSLAVTISEIIPIPDLTMSSVNKQDETVTTYKDYATSVTFEQASAKFETDEDKNDSGAIYNVTLSNIPADATELFLIYDTELYEITGMYAHQVNFATANAAIDEIWMNGFMNDDLDYIYSNTFEDLIDLTKQENGTLNLCLVVYTYEETDEIVMDITFAFQIAPVSYSFDKETKTCEAYGNYTYFNKYTDDISIEIPEAVVNEADGQQYTVVKVGGFDGFENLTGITFPTTVQEIYGFQGCTGLTTLTIPSSVTYIYGGAFRDCTSLAEIYLNSNLEHDYDIFENAGTSELKVVIGQDDSSNDIIIQDSLFASSNVKTLEIKNNVTSIGQYSFQNCANLDTIAVADSIEEIKLGAFDGTAYYNDNTKWTDNVLYLTATDNATKYLIKANTSLSGPYNIQANTKVIAGYAFRQCSALTDITIPNGVVYIGYQAFNYCTGLTCEITLPSTLKTIEEEAFYNAKITGELVIPNSVTSIGERAFELTGLSSVTLSNGITSISEDTFLSCSSLTSVVIPEGITSIGKRAFNATALTSIDLPDSITVIEDQAFYLVEELTGVLTLPDNIASVGSDAFHNCSFTGDLVIPASLVSIGQGAFAGNNFNSITVNSSNTNYTSKVKGQETNCLLEIGENNTFKLIQGCDNSILAEGITSIGYYAMAYCDSITGELVLPNSLKTIEYAAFNECTALTGVTIPDNVEIVEGWAFDSCTSLANISVGNNIKTIGQCAFNDTAYYNDTDSENWQDNVLYLSSRDGSVKYLLYSKSSVSGNYTILENTRVIADSAFSSQSNLTGVTIPGSVITIGDNCFNNCSGIKTLNLSNGLLVIGNSAFYRCSGITSDLIIPETVTSIGDHAFYNCTGIANITIPYNVTSIGEYAFYGCSGVTNLNYNANITTPYTFDSSPFGNFGSSNGLDVIVGVEEGEKISLPDYLFYGCTMIKNLEIKENVTIIGNYTFSCYNVESISLSEGLEEIGDYAFAGCVVTSVTIPDSITKLGEDPFNGWDTNQSIYFEGTSLPENLHPNWNDNCNAKIYLNGVLQN